MRISDWSSDVCSSDLYQWELASSRAAERGCPPGAGARKRDIGGVGRLHNEAEIGSRSRFGCRSVRRDSPSFRLRSLRITPHSSARRTLRAGRHRQLSRKQERTLRSKHTKISKATERERER